MRKKERIEEFLKRLDDNYGTEVPVYLHHNNAWQLLVATMLSAQCTDARVNMVTPALFEKYPEVKDLANAELKELEQDIHSTGFYHNKAKNIIACAKAVMERHKGEVPDTIEELTSLAGVGRKTANVVRGNIFKQPSVVVDTHVGRISRRMGLSKNEDPVKVEQDLMKCLPKEHWIRYNTQVIRLGREICSSQRPKCGKCFLNDICPSAAKQP